MEKSFTGKTRIRIYVFLVCIVTAFRLFLLMTYCFHQTDIDQALMWYASAEAGHFVFPEPHFYGQTYGTMMDSYLAVPLYWLHVPFNIGLPVMVSLACMAAFLIISLMLFRKGHFFPSILILLLLGLNSWRWDINTSIPRSFFSGFLFAVTGVVLINESDRKVARAIGTFLAVISVSMTMTSLAILGIGIAGILLRNRERLLKNWKSLVLGGVLGLLCAGLIHYFYILHPEYDVRPGLKTGFSMDILQENIEHLFWTLSNFMPFPSGMAALSLFAVVNVVLVVEKRYRPVALHVLLAAGTLIIMMMEHTGGGLNHTLYSKVRVFLYIPYCLAMVVYTNPDDFAISGRRAVYAVTAALMVFTFCKTDFYLDELKNPEGELYHSTAVIQEDADSCLAAAEKIVQLADELGIQSIAFRGYPGRVAAYAAAALSYGRHEVYVIDVDRRYEMREKMDHWIPREVLIITYTPDDPEGWTYSVDHVEDVRAVIRS